MRCRFCYISAVLLASVLLSGMLSGCDELKEATLGAKGTAKMQNRRQQRNTEALNLGIDGKNQKDH